MSETSTAVLHAQQSVHCAHEDATSMYPSTQVHGTSARVQVLPETTVHATEAGCFYFSRRVSYNDKQLIFLNCQNSPRK
jgi:hypothetical protein